MIAIDAKFTSNIEEELKKYIGSIQGNIIRNGAQAAAQVFYDEAKALVPVSSNGPHWFHGTSFKINGTKYLFNEGTLRDAIYQVFSKENSDDTKSTYHISWNQTKCPYGYMVEFGTSRAAAYPFFRTAWKFGQSSAASASMARMRAKINNLP
jgi:Bacteriophage HK97-gp10, putative tail-component